MRVELFVNYFIIMEDANLSPENSFLKEIDKNSDIDSTMRREIEHKFSMSKMNHTYNFPRRNLREQKCLKYSQSQKSLYAESSLLSKTKDSSLQYKGKLVPKRLPALINNYSSKYMIKKIMSPNIKTKHDTELFLIPKNAIFRSCNIIKRLTLKKF